MSVSSRLVKGITMSVPRTHIDDFSGLCRFNGAGAYNIGQLLRTPETPPFECPQPLLGEQPNQLAQAVSNLSGLVVERTVGYEDRPGILVELFCTIEPDGAPDMLFRIKHEEMGLPRIAIVGALLDHLEEQGEATPSRDYALLLNQPGISYHSLELGVNQLEITYAGESYYTPRIFVLDSKHQAQLAVQTTEKVVAASNAIRHGARSGFSNLDLRKKAWKLATQHGLVIANRDMPTLE